MAAAASIILIAGGIFLYSFLSVSPGKVFSSNYRSYELSTMRDGDTQQVSSVEKAYREKDYTKAIEAYTPNPSTTIKDNFLAAMSYIELGNSKDAIELFKKVLEQDELQKSNFLKDESEYYLALSYIRNKEPKTALELLRKIKDNPNHLYHEKITSKLIRQVKMLKWR